MTDLKKKKFLFFMVESYVTDGGMREMTYHRLQGQINFAKLCEIITESESEELSNKVRSAWEKEGFK